MNRAAHPPETREPEDLERDIDRTRSSLGRTIDELENRLSPGQLVDQALSMGRQHGGEFAANLGRSIENNPMPLLLTAVGIAWMMMSSNEPRARRYPGWEPAGTSDRLEGAKERLHGGMESAKSAASAIGERASHAREALGEGVSHAGERIQHAGESVRHGAERVRMQGTRMRDGLARLMDEQPLLVGAIGIAVGAAIGAALPRTEREDRMLGETRDNAARRLKERATDAYEEVRERASELVQRTDSGEEDWREEARLGDEQTAMPSSAPEDPDRARH